MTSVFFGYHFYYLFTLPLVTRMLPLPPFSSIFLNVVNPHNVGGTPKGKH